MRLLEYKKKWKHTSSLPPNRNPNHVNVLSFTVRRTSRNYQRCKLVLVVHSTYRYILLSFHSVWKGNYRKSHRSYKKKTRQKKFYTIRFRWLTSQTKYVPPISSSYRWNFQTSWGYFFQIIVFSCNIRTLQMIAESYYKRHIFIGTRRHATTLPSLRHRALSSIKDAHRRKFVCIIVSFTNDNYTRLNRPISRDRLNRLLEKL